MTTALNQHNTEDAFLILAAEECQAEKFDQIHKFSAQDNRLIQKLMAYGPVLVQGGRGTGKSALMIAASRKMSPYTPNADMVGLYVSLRYVPLLEASGSDYEREFCRWVSGEIQNAFKHTYSFADADNVRQLKQELSELAISLDKRIVLLFDDVAHIGRETSLAPFFTIFRTLSSEIISCKAAIYPGVTEFGARFDVYNDASVIDNVRSPELAGFEALFYDIMISRYPALTEEKITGFTLQKLAGFLGMTVLGNVRGFVYACNDLYARAEAEKPLDTTFLVKP